MTRAQELAIERVLQREADKLWAGLPDRIWITVAHGQIRYRYVGWSAALYRHQIEDEVSLDDARLWSGAGPGAAWESIASSVARKLLGARIATQHAFHTSAQSLGLVVDGRCCDLAPARLRIDRTLLELLERSGIGVHAAMAAMNAPETSQNAVHDGREIYFPWRDDMFFVRHEYEGAPTISMWVEIGRGKFDGTLIELPDTLPDVIMTAATGRRLGDIVSTGVPRLDARPIGAIIRYDRKAQIGGWFADTNTEITLEPDWVELGDHIP